MQTRRRDPAYATDSDVDVDVDVDVDDPYTDDDAWLEDEEEEYEGEQYGEQYDDGYDSQYESDGDGGDGDGWPQGGGSGGSGGGGGAMQRAEEGWPSMDKFKDMLRRVRTLRLRLPRRAAVLGCVLASPRCLACARSG
jgi:hypothetical protein